MTPFGIHLRNLRQQRGVTQTEMAKAIGVSSAYLSALEHGQRGTPSYALLQRIAGYLNIIWDDADLLQAKAELSHPRIVIDTRNLSAKATELANSLEKKIDTLSERELESLLSRINARPADQAVFSKQ